MEEQPQPLEKETAEINGSKTHRLRVVIVFLFLLTVFLVSVYTFILQRNYSENTLESAVEWNTQCADAIHKLVLQKLTGEDYKNISTIADTFRIVPLMLISPSTASVLTVGRPRAMLHSAINVGNASFPVMPMPCKS